MNQKLGISVAEAAKRLGISTRTAYEWVRRADFPAFRIGNRVIVYERGLEERVRKIVKKLTIYSSLLYVLCYNYCDNKINFSQEEIQNGDAISGIPIQQRGKWTKRVFTFKRANLIEGDPRMSHSRVRVQN